MHLSRAFIAAATAALALAACGGGSSTPTPITLPSPSPSPTSSAVTLASATSSTCVTAQATPQTVTLPDTGGITASLVFAQYDAGATGCQNITIATGSAAATSVAPASTARSVQSASSAPIVSMTLGEGLPTSLGLATVMSGATLTTDANLNFPDGTYNATVQIAAYGVNTSVQLSLVFTASHGKLTITGGTQLPVNLGSGAKLLIYDRGVVPPGFIQPTSSPSPGPSSTASATPSPAPSASPTATSEPTPTPLPTTQPGGPVPDGTTIGTFSDTISGLPNNAYGNGITYSGTIVYGIPPASVNNLQCVQNQQTGNNTCVYTGPTFEAGIASGGGVLPGTATYTINGLPAKSYRIEGCTGDVAYGGNGITGTFSIPFKTFTYADDCYVNLYSQPASVVNTPPDYGSAYMLFSIVGPVATGDTNANPAVNIP